MATTLQNAIETVKFNPCAIQQAMLSALESSLNGEIDLPDATNPFVWLMEASAVNTAVAISHDEAIACRMYAKMALTQEDLYRHMSDVDYLGRFSNPSRTEVHLCISLDEIKSKAIQIGSSEVRKITIPRNTKYNVAGYAFCQQYPIDIRVMPHGGIQIVYDVSKMSPMQTLETNVVEWSVVRFESTDFLDITIPLLQLEQTSYTDSVVSTASYTKVYSFDDYFYFCRVYMKSRGRWVEIYTTHSDQTYDPSLATAVLTVTGQKLKVHIPQIYMTSGVISSEIRIDIFTTAGDVETSLDSYSPDNYDVKWWDIDNDDNGKYTAPMNTLQQLTIYSTSKVTGGSGPLTFSELRDRVISNNTDTSLPITPGQLSTKMSDLGYTLVKNIDNVSDRMFLATRPMPRGSTALEKGGLAAGANCMMGLLSTTLSKLSSSATVRNNNRRITILPETLYKLTGGVIEVVSDEEMAKIKNYNIDQIASLINSGTYMYSPFHYVLDVNDNVFDSRAYYLDSPVIKSRSFIAENETTAIEVSTGSYSIEKITNGYKILIKTKSGDTYKTLRDDQVHVQLAFKPSDEIDYAYLNGTLLGKADDERVWEFILGTDYDIDSKDELLLNTFTMYDNQPGNYPISLLGDIEVIYAVSNYAIADLANSSIDKVLVKYQLPSDVVGIIQERFNLHLGDALSSLWSNSRSVVSELDYVRYTENIPAVYPSNVYEIDPATGRNKLFMIDGKLTMKLLHAKGEVQLVEGEVIYEHTVGEIVKVNGEGVIKDQREILRQVDIFMIDGAFRFATSPIDITYVKNLASTVVSYLEDDIAPISKQLLERTELFFYPTAQLGNITVIVGNGIYQSIPATLSFTVKFYLNEVNYNDLSLRTSLSNTAKEVIASVLKGTTVTVESIQSKIKTIAGTDIIGVDVDKLGVNKDISVFTVKDESTRASIKRVLVSLPDATLKIYDDITIDFIKHSV